MTFNTRTTYTPPPQKKKKKKKTQSDLRNGYGVLLPMYNVTGTYIHTMA